MRSLAVIAAVLLTHTAPAAAENPSPTIDEAMKLAAAADKPLILEFSAEWCGPCKVFAAKTLPDARVQAALKGVTFIQYDVDLAPGDKVAARYAISGYPTFLIVDKLGVERFRHAGAPTGEDGIKLFLEILAKAPELALDEAAIRKALKAQPKDLATRTRAAYWFSSHDNWREATPLLEALSVDTKATRAERSRATSTVARHRRLEVWKAQLLAEKTSMLRADPENVSNEDLLIAAAAPNLPAKERGELFRLVVDTVTDIDRLNNLVYIALAARETNVALVAAKRIVEDDRDAQHLDTLAECYHARGDKAQALVHVREAIAMNKNPSLGRVLEQNRERFETTRDDSRETRGYRARATELWKRLDAVDTLPEESPEPVVRTPAQVKAAERQREFAKTLREVTERLVTACSAKATGTDRAFGRAIVDKAGAVTSVRWYLERSAAGALHTCLDAEIAGVTFPAEMANTVPLSVTFKPAP